MILQEKIQQKADETEIFEEIISMLHSLSMKMYSKRRKRKLEIVQEDLKNEISLQVLHTSYRRVRQVVSYIEQPV